LRRHDRFQSVWRERRNHHEDDDQHQEHVNHRGNVDLRFLPFTAYAHAHTHDWTAAAKQKFPPQARCFARKGSPCFPLKPRGPSKTSWPVISGAPNTSYIFLTLAKLARL